MSKAYSEMSPSERIADRIAGNRRIEQSVLSGGSGLSLEGIVVRLNDRRRRATYGAVAELVGVLPRGLMGGRPKDFRNSWIVAASSGQESRRGWPTGYSNNQIHPECYRQIVERPWDVIEDAESLRIWLSQTG
jgi:hypothetical protein